MLQLDNILVFVKVAQFESISKAARSLGIPTSTVSRRLTVLESALGVSLLHRTTRRITLTPQGRDYFERCVAPLSNLEEAQQALTQSQKQPEGTLKLSVPMILNQGSFLDFLSRFSKDHTGVRLDLYVTNAYVNLVAESIDVAVRFGQPGDSNIVASRIGRSVRYVVAAPEYLKGRKIPAEPDDLKGHDCVIFNGKNNETDWDLICGRKKLRVHVSGSVSTRDCTTVSAFVIRGHGVGLLETSHCEQPLARGELVRLLPRWASTPVPVFAVYPSRKFLPPRVSAFLKALADWRTPLWERE
jgi:DNA-binding transcriptional LysR family regulator